MKLLFFGLFFLIADYGFAQKAAIEGKDLKNWDYELNPAITNDGHYISMVKRFGEKQSLVVQSIDKKWRMGFTNGAEPVFTEDSKWLLYKTPSDTLNVLQLGSATIDKIPNVSSFQISRNGHTPWLACYQSGAGNKLTLKDLASGRKMEFDSVKEYLFDPLGKSVVLVANNAVNMHNRHAVIWVDLEKIKSNTIWEGTENALGFVFSAAGTELSFLTEHEAGKNILRSVWYYRQGSKISTLTLSGESLAEKGQIIAPYPLLFNKDASSIFLWVDDMQKGETIKNPVQVEVWSYLDPWLTTETKPYGSSYASINIKNNQFFKLTGENEIPLPGAGGEHILVQKCGGSWLESNWNKAAEFSYYLVSYKDGSRKLIKDGIQRETDGLHLSPEGKWIVYYDSKEQNYFSYEIATGTTRNMTKDISTKWTDMEDDRPKPANIALGGWREWLKDDSYIFLYDNFDIWLVDPSCKKPPVNLTNGYGQLKKIRFTMTEDWRDLSKLSKAGSFLVLQGLDKETKDCGFFRVRLFDKEMPELLSTGPFQYDPNILKASKTNTYIIKRMSAIEAPNYLVTKDFKSFDPLTDVQPQKDINWLKSELLNWTAFDKTTLSGILYKPEDFDSSKKYPVIFTFYEKQSDNLNKYLIPGYTESTINIPWFVSRGYLIFVPDINYRIGSPGESAVNCIVSAANFLAEKPWIDRGKMGLYGHSWGGYEVNYVITRTNIFKAAVEAAGSTNFTSGYGLTSHGGQSRTWVFETHQSRMGATLWEKPDDYIENSPVFRADKVSTPLLIMHNKKDHQVSWSDGLQWFNYLRRLGKKVWMLQYENGDHGLEGQDAIDYTHRIEQYYDHYLKGQKPARWMTTSLGSENTSKGYELDERSSTPGQGLLPAPLSKDE